MARPDLKPFEDNQEVHVAKHQHHEHNLWNKFKIELKLFFKVNGVDSFQSNSECHVDDPNYHTNLHLQTIDKSQLVLCPVPYRINTDGIDTSLVPGEEFLLWIARTIHRNVVAGAEYVETQAHKVVVDPPTVESKETHQQNHVPHLKQRVKCPSF